tara:strand:+ start:41 stop:568 length:528 start_codon:yes stop_codon:yes gene_type:complete
MMTSNVQATPDYPANQSTSDSSPSSAIKVATPDLIITDGGALPVDLMTDLLFENVGGQEIIGISRNDIVNGQDVSYQLISNTKLLDRRYNPNNVFSISGTLDKYFANFSIRLDVHIPENGTGPEVLPGQNQRVYVDSLTGDVVIDITNMETNERLDVEILKEGSVDNDTIYVEAS